MLSVRLVPILLLAASILLASCQRGSRDVGVGEEGDLRIGQVEVTETTSRGVNPGNRTLVIDGFNGDIELTGTDGANAQLEFTKRARGRNDSAAREALADVTVDESGTDDAYIFQLRADRTDRSAVDVRGSVPVGTPLRINLSNGTVSLSAVDGPIDVDVANGTVRIGGTSRDVTVDLSNGDIWLGTRMIQPDGRIRLETANGTVTMRMPGSASAQVDARTSVGAVRVSGLDFANRRLQQEGAGSRFSGQIGGGNARIELRVQNGRITLEEGQTLALERMNGEALPPVEEPLMDEMPEQDADGLERDTLVVDTNAVN
jgi:predicted small secreted protein